MGWLTRGGIGLAGKGLTIAGSLVLAFYTGAYLSATAPAQPTTAIIEPWGESRPLEKHAARFINRTVTKINITPVAGRPGELTNFSGLEELKRWLLTVETDSNLIYLQSPDSTVDCDDYALALQQKALSDGFLLSFQVVSRDQYNIVFRNKLSPGQSLHAVNLAIIGNNVYYVEPQTGEVALATFLD